MTNEELHDVSASLADTSQQDLLNAHDLRVLAVLAEKEALTPDIYPLSLNALTNGCNQLSSRDPVMSLSEADVQATLDRLTADKFVTEVRQAGARVAKYEHRLRVKWLLEQDKLAVLTVLMLRGPQTAGEIRTRCGRLHEFASIAEVEQSLQFLMDKYPPLVARLARAPGTKEARYAHLLSGEISEEMMADEAESGKSAGTMRGDRIAQLEAEVQSLKDEMQELKKQFQQFRQQFD
ncbi:MAG: YceH family protein [Oxalicibacterium faecigallinarum]|uniref:YceH family protein n=1 Tax=Oxalicibacterium faecigallinarum TaxID=573741 RepID=UPI0028069A51|nr:YceH family protein [Oxalicibacterium faecigallinarum]MDQ7968765.1 YceH family protein [Oxalicibacterium faecigallinarum]